MKQIDRRKVLTGMICGGAVVALGLSAVPNTAKSTPLGAVKGGVIESEGLVQQARVSVYVRPRHRRRRRGKSWRCWWHRGRRVCGWRW
jgi:hypothetical protein